MDKIIDIHQFMVTEMQKVLREFLQLPQDVRRSFTGKGCETTAELLVSIAVEQQLAVRCEDVEQAVIRYEEPLQGHPEFTRWSSSWPCVARMWSRLSSDTRNRSRATRSLRGGAAAGRALRGCGAGCHQIRGTAPGPPGVYAVEQQLAVRCEDVEQAVIRYEEPLQGHPE